MYSYTPGPFLDSRETSVNKTDKNPGFMKHAFWDEEINDKK